MRSVVIQIRISIAMLLPIASRMSGRLRLCHYVLMCPAGDHAGPDDDESSCPAANDEGSVIDQSGGTPGSDSGTKHGGAGHGVELACTLVKCTQRTCLVALWLGMTCMHVPHSVCICSSVVASHFE